MFDWIDTLTGLLKSCLTDVLNCEQNVDNLSMEAGDLESMRAELRAQLDAVEHGGVKPADRALWWVGEAKKLVKDAADVKVRFEKRVRCVGDISPDVWSVYWLSKRAEDLLKKVKTLKSKRSEITTLGGAEPAPEGAKERPVRSTVVGIDSVLERLLGYVRDENVSVIGVHGMGGVGKTELLSQLNNELLAMHDKYVIWIDMPPHAADANADADFVQNSVFQQLGLKWDANKSRDKRARLVSEKLSQRNFVLIIDGLWRFLDLKVVGIPAVRCPTKSSIVLATRIELLCDRMGAQKKVPMKCLEWQDAWKLFAEKAGEELIDSKSTEIHSSAKALAKKCGGLPLALIHVGTAMRSKKTTEQWRYASKILSTAPWQLIGTEVLTPLKLSLDKITDQRLRTCLLYCSLHPEDLPICMDWIVDYCIGEGVIDDVFSNVDEMYSAGRSLLGDLEAMSLLESCDDESYIKIHPMIRGMMLENKCLVRAGSELRAPPLLKDWSGAQRISLMQNDLQELSERPQCPDLVTLFLHENPRLKKICDGFFQSMVNLRVLDLSNTAITELPAGIEVLNELRYLDVCCTNIMALPSELRMLRKLRFLLLTLTLYLKYIPDGVIGSLPELQVLYMDLSYGDWKVGSVGSGVNFDELTRLKKLRALGITIESVLALHRLLESLELAASIRRLQIKGCAGLTTIQLTTIGGSIMSKCNDLEDVSGNIASLNFLWLYRCNELEDVVIKDGDSGDGAPFPSLQLKLERLPKARIIWDSGCLTNLRFLHIWYCDRMEQLFYCRDEDIKGDGDDDGIDEEEESGGAIKALPQLKMMQLYGLPELKSLRCGRRRLAFPHLEIVEVVECPKLKKLDLVAEKLREIQGSELWWNGLDDATKSAFARLFREKK